MFQTPSMFFYFLFYFILFIKLFVIKPKTDILCREMEVAGAEMGRDYASQVPVMFFYYY